MATPTVSQEQLQRVHKALRIAVPLEQASPMVLSTLAVIAHCWAGRIPANLWSDTELQHPSQPEKAVAAPPKRCPALAPDHDAIPAPTDFKRRASGDFD
jgi:hypothetical protein